MMLSLRSAPSVRPARASGVRVAPRVARPVLVRSTPKEIDEKLEAALKEAESCAAEDGNNCANEWENVEELAAARSHMKDAAKADPSLNDPLEAYCKDNADADECRVYED